MEFVADGTERLDVFLARAVPNQSRSRIAQLISGGHVLVDGRARKPSFKLEQGMLVSLQEPPKTAAPTPRRADAPALEILFEDEHLLVVNKQAGVSVHPSPTSNEPTLTDGLLLYSHKLSTLGGDFRPGVVHRLDKDTSGALLVAKTDEVHRALQNAIQKREVKRAYYAWVPAKPDKDEFTIRCYIARHPKNRQKMAVVDENTTGARLAITHCKFIGGAQGVYVLECSLETGRTHQIRVHLASIGLPVIGDKVYGRSWPGLERQALHAARIEFTHPATGKRVEISAPIPPDLSSLPYLP